MGDILHFRARKTTVPPSPESRLLCSMRERLGVQRESNYFSFDSVPDFEPYVSADGSVQAGAGGVSSFEKSFGDIEIKEPFRDSIEWVNYLLNPDSVTLTVDSNQLYEFYSVSRLVMDEARKVQPVFHQRLGRLASSLVSRPIDDARPVEFDNEHVAEDYIIGKYAARVAIDCVVIKSKDEDLGSRIRKRAADRIKQIEVDECEKEYLRHFAIELVFAKSESGHIVTPSEAVHELIPTRS